MSAKHDEAHVWFFALFTAICDRIALLLKELDVGSLEKSVCQTALSPFLALWVSSGLLSGAERVLAHHPIT